MVEEILKSMILEKYGSLREFSIQTDMPYSTLSSIFKRGVEKAGIGNIIKICNALSLSVDELAVGKVVSKVQQELSSDEAALISIFRSLNGDGKSQIMYMVRLIASDPSMKKESGGTVTA